MTAVCYGLDVDDAQRNELLARRRGVDQAIGDHNAAIARRNDQLVTLRRQGIGATYLTKVLSEGRAHPVNRVTVARILGDAGAGNDHLDRNLGRAFADNTDDVPDDLRRARDDLRAAQALVDTSAAAVTRAVDNRDATVIRLATAEAVGPTEQAGVLDMSRKTLQDVVDRHRVTERRRGNTDQ